MKLQWWPRPTVTSCPHNPFLCWHLFWGSAPPWVAWLYCGPSLIPFSQSWIAKIPFPSWNPSESCPRRVVINQMDKVTVSTLAPNEQDLVLGLENALLAFLWYSPHAAQSGISRHHMLKERRWSHQDIFMMIWSEPPQENKLSPVWNQLKDKPRSYKC